MRAAIVVGLVFILSPALLWSGPQMDSGTQAAKIIGALQMDIHRMGSSLSDCRKNHQQFIVDAERVSANYNRLIPVSGAITPAEQEHNRKLTKQAFSLMARANSECGANSMVSRALMQTYLSIGDFYQMHDSFYPAGATIAYWGANQRALSPMADSRNSRRFNHDLERFAAAWEAASHVDRAVFDFFAGGDKEKNSPYTDKQVQEIAYKPVVLPQVNEGGLNPEQQKLWQEIRTQFYSVAARVNEARILLDQLSSRLERKNMNLNVQDAAAAVSMQKFLEDAVEFVRAGEFEKAKVSLTRSEYLRGQLKPITGQ